MEKYSTEIFMTEAGNRHQICQTTEKATRIFVRVESSAGRPPPEYFLTALYCGDSPPRLVSRLPVHEKPVFFDSERPRHELNFSDSQLGLGRVKKNRSI